MFAVAEVTGLKATNLGNTVDISFSEVARAVTYTVVTTPAAPSGAVTLQPSDAVNGVLSTQFTGLQLSTVYIVSVQAQVANSDGSIVNSNTATFTLTTGGKYL